MTACCVSRGPLIKQCIKNILSTYEKGTGQLLSPDKCSIVLRKKCSMEDQVDAMVILCITADGFEDKYLGLPVP